MAENMNSGGGMTIDDFKEILKELGIGQSGKNAKVKVQVDTAQATQNVNELEEAFQKLWKGITNNKTKSKYFQSLENAAIDVKKTWNDLVSQIENTKKNVNFDINCTVNIQTTYGLNLKLINAANKTSQKMLKALSVYEYFHNTHPEINSGDITVFEHNGSVEATGPIVE